MFRALINTDHDYVPLFVRLALAVVFFPHGAQKVLGWFGGYGFDATMQFFGTMGIPALLAFLAIVAEFCGSIGLAMGLLGRVAAFAISCVMIVAVATSHLQHGFFMNWGGMQKGEGFEYHVLALTLLAIIMARGSGAWSLDRALSTRRATHGSPNPAVA